MGGDIFTVNGRVEIWTDDAVKGLDAVVAKSKATAADIKKQADGIEESVEEGLDIPVEKYRKQSEEVVRETRRTKEGVEGQANGIHAALENAFSFSAGQLISDGLREAWNFMKDFAMESLSVASDLAEVQNVVDVTFGDGASAINTWAKSAKNAFGMGELKAKQFAGTMGAMLKSMGFTGDEVMDMSTNLTQLAGDMASFYNLDHEEAFDKIRAGISGETEPLKQLGINMSVANLEAYAMSQGIDKAYESMTQAEQAALRYNYLISATADAQGDFNRTSDSYANQVKLLQENIDKVKGIFGNALIDILTPQLQGVNDLLNDWLEEDNSLTAQIADIEKTAEEEVTAITGVGMRANILIDVLESMADETQRTDEEQQAWLKTLEELVDIMPELAKYIDLTNGELRISTEELRGYANNETLKEIARVKSAALAKEQAAIDAQREKMVDQNAKILATQAEANYYQEKRDKTLEELAAKYGFNPEEHNWDGDRASDIMRFLTATNMDWEDQLAYGDAYDDHMEYQDLLYDVECQTAAYEKQKEELEKLQAAHDRKDEAIDDMYREQLDAIEAQDAYNASLQEELTALSEVEDAVAELTAYYNGLRDAARASLNAVVGGFEKVEQLAGADWKTISENMQSQNAWLQEYKSFLQEAQSWGLDEDLLAQLSDGSSDSAAILKMLSGMSAEEREKFNSKWLTNQQLADETAELMAANQAAADDEYQAMQKNVEALVENYNQKEAARAAMLETGNGAIDAMDTTIGVLREQAAEVQELLKSTFGGNYSLNISLPTGGDTTPGQNAKGLGYVPYDNYLTYLHKGESVLSRVEADNWRKGAQNGSMGIDYDRLAAALAAEMGGITMQMDGRMIGALVAPTVSRNLEKEAYRGRY